MRDQLCQQCQRLTSGDCGAHGPTVFVPASMISGSGSGSGFVPLPDPAAIDDPHDRAAHAEWKARAASAALTASITACIEAHRTVVEWTEQQNGVMRVALEHVAADDDEADGCAYAQEAKTALTSDAGRGWLSPVQADELRAQVTRLREERDHYREGERTQRNEADTLRARLKAPVPARRSDG